MIKDVCKKKYLIYVVSLESQKPDGVGVKISSHNYGLIRYRLLLTSFNLNFNYKISCCDRNWKKTKFHFFGIFISRIGRTNENKTVDFFITVKPYSQVLKEFLNKFSN